MSILFHQLKIAWRNLLAHRDHFLLTLTGFVVGLSCFATIMIYVHYEFSFDTFHSDHRNIYRITTHLQRGPEDTRWALTNGSLVPVLREKIPGVKEAIKMFPVYGRQVFKIDDQTHTVEDRSGFYVDQEFFEIFDFTFIAGDKNSAFNQPDRIVLTEKLARKYFDDLDIIGKVLVIKGRNEQEDQVLEIAGVLKDPPQNSHLQFDFLIRTSGEFWDRFENPEAGFPVYVYFKVHDSSHPQQLKSMISDATKDIYPGSIRFPIQKITDIYFHADNLFEHARSGNLEFTRTLMLIAFFILIISIINYVIMSTSHSLQRAKEIGIKKVFGISRTSLIRQFLFEGMLLCLVAGLISIILIEIVFSFVFIDWFDLRLSLFDNQMYILIIILFSVFTGFIAGLFPALRLSNLKATSIFQGNLFSQKSAKVGLRDILVTAQFVFTIVIIVSSIVVLRQLYFLKNKDLGFNKNLVINIPRTASINESSWDYFKQSIRNESRIKSVGTTLYPLIGDYNTTSVRFSDESTNDTIPLRVQWNAIDYDLVPTMEMEIIQGRNFSPDIASDSFAIIINESAKNELGDKNIMDSRVHFWMFGERTGKVIGIIKDFHFQSFDQKILPTVFVLRDKRFSQSMLIRLSGENYQQTLSMLKQRWEESEIEAPFMYDFLDDWVKVLIEKEERLSSMTTVLSILTILISITGLLGLISYTVGKRTREIGIRKVFGASLQNILFLLNRRFMALILIALLLAVPLAILGLNNWLEQFAYRITINSLDIFIALLIILLLPGGVISLKCWQAARINPAMTLRDE